MITLRLSDDEAIRVLVVMEQNLYDLIELFNRSQNMSLIKTITKGRFIVHELRRVLNLPEYAAEIDKLEAKESNQNDSETMDSEPDAALR
jgi:phosphoribosylamine-glycine ligase